MSSIDPDELDDLPGTPPAGMTVEQYRRILDPRQTPIDKPEKTALPGRGIEKRPPSKQNVESTQFTPMPSVAELEGRSSKKRPTMSPEARAKIAEAQRKRHAREKARKAATANDDHKRPELSSNEPCVAPVIDKPDPGREQFKQELFKAEDMTGKVSLKPYPGPIPVDESMLVRNPLAAGEYNVRVHMEFKSSLLADMSFSITVEGAQHSDAALKLVDRYTRTIKESLK